MECRDCGRVLFESVSICLDCGKTITNAAKKLIPKYSSSGPRDSEARVLKNLIFGILALVFGFAGFIDIPLAYVFALIFGTIAFVLTFLYRKTGRYSKVGLIFASLGVLLGIARIIMIIMGRK